MALKSETTEFDDNAFSSAYPLGVERNFWNLARNYIITRELDRDVRAGLISRKSRILEIGCGTGVVVRHLRNYNWDAYGVELGAPKLVAGAEKVIWTRRWARDLDDDFRISVSCILLLDVIEHVADAERFLREISAAFPCCKCFIVSVPARQEVWSNYDEFYGHYRRYDRALFDRTLAEANLKVIRRRYFFHTLYIAAVFIKCIGRKRRVSILPTKRPKLHRLIALILYLEARVTPSFILGLSLIGTAVPADN